MSCSIRRPWHYEHRQRANLKSPKTALTLDAMTPYENSSCLFKMRTRKIQHQHRLPTVLAKFPTFYSKVELRKMLSYVKLIEDDALREDILF
jgi:hypothetical protein